MQLRAIRHWQWVVISLALGAIVGYLRTQAAGDLEGRFGQAINGQARFEKSLIAAEQGRKCFTDIYVHAWPVADGKGGMKQAYVVSGSYFDGHLEQQEGKLEATWRPAFFVAETPYKAVNDLGALGHPDLVQRYRAIANPTVADYLSLLSETNGVAYTHAWWLEMGLGSWLLLSFVLVGVVIPCGINLALYGSLRRPPEEKGTDLSKVTTVPPAKSDAAKVTDADLAQVAAMEAKLGENAAPAKAPQPPKPATVKDLAAEKLKPVAVTPQSEAEFRSKKDDFYPTARPGSPGDSKPPRK
jgi:hypothetical protein